MPISARASTLRQAALDASLRLHAQIDGEFALRPGVSRNETTLDAEFDIRSTAETFYAWLNGTTRIRLEHSQPTKQDDTSPNPAFIEEYSVQIHDDEKFDLTVHTVDAKGFETADTIYWTVDNTDVVTLTVSDDGRSCTVVAGSPGSAVITVTDTATDPQLSATEAVDVVPGGTATITLTEGDVSKQ